MMHGSMNIKFIRMTTHIPSITCAWYISNTITAGDFDLLD